MTPTTEAKIRGMARGRGWPRYLLGDVLAEVAGGRADEPFDIDTRVRRASILHTGRRIVRLTTPRFEQAPREYIAANPDATLWEIFTVADAEAQRWFAQKRRETRMSPPYRLPAPTNANAT